MRAQGSKLNQKMEQVIASLLVEPTVQAAVKVAGISEATLWRWMQLQEFQDVYRQAKRQVVSHAITQLQQATSEAVRVLRDIMTNPDSKDSARVTAAKTVLDTALKAVEMEDLSARVETLEKGVDETGT